jgi:hypothetical protein
MFSPLRKSECGLSGWETGDFKESQRFKRRRLNGKRQNAAPCRSDFSPAWRVINKEKGLAQAALREGMKNHVKIA